MKQDTSQKVLQGDCKVILDGNGTLSALLGSCVSACIWDQAALIGGMNHIMLPDDPNNVGRAQLHGASAMETLVNSILRAGGSKDNLCVMLLGGAQMHKGNFDVGRRNTDFAMRFVEREGYELVDTCLGGEQGRYVQFWPMSGRVLRRFVGNRGMENTVVHESTKQKPRQGNADFELF